MLKKIKITPFLVVFGIIEIILLVVAIKYLLINNEGGMGLAGVIALIGAIIIFFVLTIEQFIANNLKNLKVLWSIEIVILILLAVRIFVYGISFG